MPPLLLLSADAPSSSPKPASASKPSSAAAVTSCIDHLDTSHVAPIGATSSAMIEEHHEPTAALQVGAQYDLDTSATTGAATTSAATATIASTTSPPTKSLVCPISSTGTSRSTPPSTHKDAQEVFESMLEPFGQSQDAAATAQDQNDAREFVITLVFHPSTWYQQIIVPSVPCSVSLHIQMVFDERRRIVTGELRLSWPLHVQANFSDCRSIGQLDIDDTVPLFPWNPGGYLSGSRNQLNMVLPATIRGSHWFVPNVCDEWVRPPWDSGQQANVSYDQFFCVHQYTCLPGYFVTGGQKQDIVTCSTLQLCLSGFSPSFHPRVMRELQLAGSGSICLYLQKLQMDRSGIERAALNSLSININLCQLKWSESILAYPADMALYCPCFSSASEGIFCESKLELNNWVAYMVKLYVDMPSSGTKTDLHFLCISTSIPLKQNRYVAYALLVLVQSAALKYTDLCRFTTAILTDIMSIFGAGISMQMNANCSVQPRLLLTHAYHLSILAPTMFSFACGNLDCTFNSWTTRSSLQVTCSEFSAWFSLQMIVACSTQQSLMLPHAYQLTCDPAEVSCHCVLISLNLHCIVSFVDCDCLGWVAHQAVFCKTGTELPSHFCWTSSTGIHQSDYEAVYNKRAWELAMGIYPMGHVREENSVTWLVVCTIFLAPGDPSDVLFHHVIRASGPCVTARRAGGCTDKNASSHEIVICKDFRALWDPGGHTPPAFDDTGLRASRMLRWGECHEPCGPLHWVAWAARRRAP